ncbi:type VII secretion system-associated protein [Nocardia sp. NBC_00416]|uniref:type VII secretion system-associated protein n=1 Tax=Nocardia sp. NBC_00416 TaxID=2975991 RepID=UPI002E204981
MEDATPHVAQQGDWFVQVDPGWQETAPEEMPPSAAILGGWMIGADGIPGPFEPNPNYAPADESMPTDPIHAVLSRVADSDGFYGDEVLAALRGAVVEIGCDEHDEPLIGPAPDGFPCVAIATAAIHKHRVEADRWWPVPGVTLPIIVPAGTDILLNPDTPTQFRLHTRSLRSIESGSHLPRGGSVTPSPGPALGASGLSAELVRMARRLGIAATDAGEALHAVTAQFPASLRMTIDTLAAGTSNEAQPFDQLDTDTSHYMGESRATGASHTFTASQVRGRPVHKFDGSFVGLSFPLKSIDGDDRLTLTSKRPDSVRGEHCHAETAGGLWPPRRLLPPGPKRAFGSPSRTSSAHKGSRGLVIARAQADTRIYGSRIGSIPLTRWGLWTPPQVDGRVYGRILACSPAEGPAAFESPES